MRRMRLMRVLHCLRTDCWCDHEFRYDLRILCVCLYCAGLYRERHTIRTQNCSSDCNRAR